MKRTPIIAGNWKMYKNRDEALAFIYKLKKGVFANVENVKQLFVHQQST